MCRPAWHGLEGSCWLDGKLGCLLGCRVGWSAARSDIPPDLLSAHEVGGVVVAAVPLLVGQVEDRWAEERGLLTEQWPGRRSMLKARLAWAPLL